MNLILTVGVMRIAPTNRAASPLLDDDDDDDDDGVVDVDDDIDGDAIGVDPLDEGAVPEASHAARAPPSSTASSSTARVRRRGNNGGAGLGIAAKAVAESGGGGDGGSDDGGGGGGSSATLFQQVSKYLVGDEAAEEIINRMNAAERADEVARAGEELEKILYVGASVGSWRVCVPIVRSTIESQREDWHGATADADFEWTHHSSTPPPRLSAFPGE